MEKPFAEANGCAGALRKTEKNGVFNAVSTKSANLTMA